MNRLGLVTSTPQDEPKPDALRLADELVEPIEGYTEPTQLEKRAASELRRLHAELKRWEGALREAWQMVDVLRPPGVPGSYARGAHNGFVDALTTLQAKLNKTPNANP